MQAYSDPRRESDPFALPNVEVFHVAEGEMQSADMDAEDGEMLPAGWYYWFCFPGCMPDSDPSGPFATEAEALADAQEGYDGSE